MYSKKVIAVVIPAYKVSSHIAELLRALPNFIDAVYVVDDNCPDRSGRHAEGIDDRVMVIFRKENGGVGAATKTGFLGALEGGADVIVKMDGDGQMNPLLIESLIKPVIANEADFSKGNRFSSARNLEKMPKARVFGNAALSVFGKASTGYWGVVDFTNGFLAVSSEALRDINLGKLHDRFFFESDLMFRAGVRNATVAEVGMKARYGAEKSNLKIWKVALTFPFLHLRNIVKRIAYKYYGPSWSIASFELPLGILGIGLGTSLGIDFWLESSNSGVPATAGEVILAALPVIVGSQLLLSFVNYDVSVSPSVKRYTAE